MRNIVVVFMLLIMVSACNSDSKGYLINAKIDGLKDGTKVTLRTFKNNKPVEIDTTSVKNGAFSFKGTVEAPDIHNLRLALQMTD